MIVVTALGLLTIPPTDGNVGMKDYVGWAVALVFVWLIWMLHTTVHKGLLQLWRYTQGETKFKA